LKNIFESLEIYFATFKMLREREEDGNECGGKWKVNEEQEKKQI
jgi:hypothetical protein